MSYKKAPNSLVCSVKAERSDACVCLDRHPPEEARDGRRSSKLVTIGLGAGMFRELILPRSSYGAVSVMSYAVLRMQSD